jgi:hypothetical protein
MSQKLHSVINLNNVATNHKKGKVIPVQAVEALRVARG